MRARPAALLPLAAAGLAVALAGCSQAVDAVSSVNDAAQAVTSVRDTCAQAETALASGKPSEQIAASFAQPLQQLRDLLEGATVIPGLQGVVDALDAVQQSLQAGGESTDALARTLADACAVVGQ